MTNKAMSTQLASPAQPLAQALRGCAWALLLMVLLLPLLAAAQTAPPSNTPFVVQPNDYFVNFMLKGLLGDVVNVNSSTASSSFSGAGTLGEVFRVFNLGVAFFGSIIIMFVAVVGILNSGQDGEFLGRKWSSFWVPVRFAGGAALMLPVTSSGYSFVQAMCIWVAGQGIGFADSLWSAILENHSPRTGTQIIAPVSTTQLVTQITASEVCRAYINNRPAGLQSDQKVSFAYFWDDNAAKQTRTASGIWLRGSTLTNMFNTIGTSSAVPLTGVSSSLFMFDPARLEGKDVCGRMTYSWRPDSQNPYEILRERISVLHIQEIDRIRQVMAPLADGFVAAAYTAPDPATGANTALDNAEAAIRSAITQQSAVYRDRLVQGVDQEIAASSLGNIDRMKDTMKQLGFAMAGAFYMELAKTQNAVRAGMSAIPGYKAPDLVAISEDYGSDNWNLIKTRLETNINQTVMSASEQARNGSYVFSNTAGSNVQVKTIDLNEKTFTNIATTGVDGVSHEIAMAVLRSIIQVGSTNNEGGNIARFMNESGNMNNSTVFVPESVNHSVIMQLKDKGDTILNIAGLFYTAHLLATSAVQAGDSTIWGAGVNAFTGGVKFISSILSNLSSMVFAIVMGLLTLGILLAVLIPMTPFMIWVMGLAGLLVLVIEALVASMLWAVMIMHPSGEGITSDHSREGLWILMILFFRPALMLMGMVAGIFLVDPMIDYVNDVFYMVFKSTQQETFTGIFIVFGICSVYVTLVLSIVRKSFALIHMIPDRVLRWVGRGHGEHLGESEVADRGEAMAGSAGQRVSNITTSMRRPSDAARAMSDIRNAQAGATMRGRAGAMYNRMRGKRP